MNQLPTAATAQSTQPTASALVSGVQVATAEDADVIANQSITAYAHAEIMADADTGQPVLCVATDEQLSDFQQVTPARALAAAEKLRDQANHIEALAKKYAAATGERHTWSFTDRNTGEQHTVTCMVGCDADHTAHTETPTFITDVHCTDHEQDNTSTLPVYCGSDATPGIVLSTLITVDPFAPDPARRLPYAVVEVIEDHWIEGLDPDGLAAVIDHFEQRTAAMRARHADLVRARNEHIGRQA